MFSYKPSGVCAREIQFELNGDTIEKVQFIGGCPGNTLGLSLLLQGMSVQKAIDLLSDVKCGSKDTSCPAQLARALKQSTSKYKRKG